MITFSWQIKNFFREKPLLRKDLKRKKKFFLKQIVEVEMPFDKQKNQRKAFCFITFDSEQVVNELLKTPKQTISGKEVDVKRATPKPENGPQMMMRGGRGAPRGGGPRGKGRLNYW